MSAWLAWLSAGLGAWLVTAHGCIGTAPTI